MSKPWETIENNWFNYEHVYKRIVESVPHDGKIVEVGCWKGASTIFLALGAREKNISVFAVDTWLGSDEHKNTEEVKDKKLFSIFIENMKPVIDDISILRTSSVSASRIFDDNSLDAVFIDADHRYEMVSADIMAWMPKVKTGGILAGHDFCEHWASVKRAVNELVPKFEVIKDCWYSIK